MSPQGKNVMFTWSHGLTHFFTHVQLPQCVHLYIYWGKFKDTCINPLPPLHLMRPPAGKQELWPRVRHENPPTCQSSFMDSGNQNMLSRLTSTTDRGGGPLGEKHSRCSHRCCFTACSAGWLIIRLIRWPVLLLPTQKPTHWGLAKAILFQCEQKITKKCSS